MRQLGYKVCYTRNNVSLYLQFVGSVLKHCKVPKYNTRIVDSTIFSGDSSLSLDGYKLIRSDHPKDIKQRRVCIDYRETLLVKTLDINHLPECLVCEYNYENKKSLLLNYIGLLVKPMINLMSLFVVLKA